MVISLILECFNFFLCKLDSIQLGLLPYTDLGWRHSVTRQAKSSILARSKYIKVVSIDMWRPYAGAVRNVLPRAQVVVDRFHAMKQLNERLQQARRRLQSRADKTTCAALKGCYWLLLKRRIDLTPDEKTRLQTALNAAPELRHLYLLKERFWLIFERSRSPAQAQRFLLAWLCEADQLDNRYLNKFTSTLRNWWYEILAYFDERVTNGFVEGINRAIRGVIRRAYAYHSFDNFRLAVLAVYG